MMWGMRGKALLVLAVIALGVAADQAVKVVAVDLLSGRPPVEVAGGLLVFRYVENPGAILSLGAGLSPSQRSWIFTVAVGAILAALVAFVVLSRGTRALELWAVALIASGGVGNLIDRVRFGFVRDYVLLAIGRLPTAVFNLADAAITAGGVLLLIHLLTSRRGK